MTLSRTSFKSSGTSQLGNSAGSFYWAEMHGKNWNDYLHTFPKRITFVLS